MAKQVEKQQPAVKWNVKIPGDVNAAIKELADKEDRTQTNMFIVLLKAALRRRGVEL